MSLARPCKAVDVNTNEASIKKEELRRKVKENEGGRRGREQKRRTMPLTRCAIARISKCVYKLGHLPPSRRLGDMAQPRERRGQRKEERGGEGERRQRLTER